MTTTPCGAITSGVLVLLLAADAQGQGGPGTDVPNEQGRPAIPIALSSVATEQPRRDVSPVNRQRRTNGSGPFAVFSTMTGVPQEHGHTLRGDFGSTWRLKTGISYAGGVEMSASTIVRRGYSLPIAMALPIGGDLQPVEHRNSTLDFGWPAVHWDTQFQVVKRLKTSGAVDVSIVGDVLNFVDVNGTAPDDPAAAIHRRRTARIGIVLGF